MPDETDAELLDQYLRYLPEQQVGVEHEYKWLLSGYECLPSIADEIDRLGRPAGYAVAATGRSRQSSIYVDDDTWSITDAGVSLTVIVRHGWKRSVCWLITKDTVVWERGRRDTVEMGVRIDPARVSEALADWELMPMRRLAMRLGFQPRLAPYATNVQQRTKASLQSESGSVLSMSIDDATVSAAGADRQVLENAKWIEIECNQTDGLTLDGLDKWAAMITAATNTEPYEHSKPSRAATLLGYHEADLVGGPSDE